MTASVLLTTPVQATTQEIMAEVRRTLTVAYHSLTATLLRELEIGAVPHGFRSSFRDWAAECTDAPREVCELALAHVNSDRVGAAYRRTDLFDKRRELMGARAGYIA